MSATEADRRVADQLRDLTPQVLGAVIRRFGDFADARLSAR